MGCALFCQGAEQPTLSRTSATVPTVAVRHHR